jgi:tRNA G18 (ribose-2'-O)-methylase SpoU
MDNDKNVIDAYKGWDTILVKEDLERKALPYSVMMQHIQGDFNISTFIRNGNAFGVREIYYYGKRKWDRRGAVGTHNYKQLTHLDSFEEIKALKDSHRFIAIENGVPNALSINDFTPKPNDLFIFGEEMMGISQEVLALCDLCVYIPQYGSVRSLNVGTASGILMQYISHNLSSQTQP